MAVLNSKSAFAAALKELELSTLVPKFEANGWDSFNDFAFSTSDPTGKDAEAFTKEVIAVLIDLAGE